MKNKKIISTVLALVLLLSAISLNAYGAASGQYSNNISWAYDDYTKTLTLSGSGVMEKFNGTNPWDTYKNSITQCVFNEGITEVYCEVITRSSTLKKVVFADSITHIGKNVFGWNTALNDVKLGKGLKYLDSAFHYCYGLTDITVPYGCKVLYGGVFEGCRGLRNVNLPDTVKSLGVNAFYECIELQSIKLPKSLEYIDPNAFGNCFKLKSLTIPSSVKYISGGVIYDKLTPTNKMNYEPAFTRCDSLTDITILSSDAKVYDASNSLPSNAKIHFVNNDNIKAYADKYGLSYDYICVDGSTNHSYTTSSTATCTQAGNLIYTCSKCGYSYKDSSSQLPLGHNYSVQTVGPTCESEGYTLKTCDRCGDSVKSNVVSALGHDCYWVTTKAASETETGLEEYICKRCSKVVEQRQLPMIMSGTLDTVYNNFRLLRGVGSVKIAWDIDTNVNGYEVYYSDSIDGEYNKIDDIKASDKNYCVMSSLVSGQIIYVKIKAYKLIDDKIMYANDSNIISAMVK